MLLTNTVHPPGGASAVLAATDPAITAMGWYFAGLVLWGTTLMVVVGLVVNNIQRQFPMYWWTPLNLKGAEKEDKDTVPDARGGIERKEGEAEQKYGRDDEQIQITGAGVFLPEDLSLNADETKMLEMMRERLRERVEERASTGEQVDSSSERSSTEMTVVPSRSGSGLERERA
jgi:CBS-domain-containing membrane protein